MLATDAAGEGEKDGLRSWKPSSHETVRARKERKAPGKGEIRGEAAPTSYRKGKPRMRKGHWFKSKRTPKGAVVILNHLYIATFSTTH